MFKIFVSGKSMVVVPVLIVIVFSLIITGCNKSTAENDIAAVKDSLVIEAKRTADLISVEELIEMIASDDSLAIIDIRTQAEFDQGHIKNSRWIPRGKLEVVAAKGKLGGESDLLVLYCKMDTRGSLGAATLTELGFSKVKYLAGGFKAWAEAGGSIYNMHGELTIKNFEKPESNP
ncbi:MAG: rhodanese-like domain-containing protein [FCB group bacterium]|nr:rhodanese-like domain-containing protein [FCB group bacterium]